MEGSDQIYGAGDRLGEPAGDPSREAVASLRGYAYQIYASALAWLRLVDGETLYLEVAEDYAVAVRDVLNGVQVRDTAGSGALTIRSEGVATSIDAFVDLAARNPARRVTLRYLTTSPLGQERATQDRVEGGPALAYWRRAAGGAPVGPLRAILERMNLRPATLEYIASRDDEALRDELIRRIGWDVGQAPLDDLAEELAAGLVEFASSALRLAADVGRQMVDATLLSVLRTSIKGDNRSLRRADLIELGEGIGRISLPRDAVEGMFRATGGRSETLLAIGALEAGGSPLASRPLLLAEIDERLSTYGFAVVTGSTGMGKTHVASRAAQRRGEWQVADFYSVPAAVAVLRLRTILGEASASAATTLVLDDLDCMDDPGVRGAVVRLVVAMRRREGSVIATTASSPTARALDALCSAPSTAVEVPYLTIDEVGDLIEQTGGNRTLARLIHLAGAAGHPQLVQAAILHMRAADWSRGAVRALLGGEVPDVTEERRAARDRLVAAIPSASRTMLYRTSMVLGRFSRTLALTLADVEPVVREPGAEIDRLVGPWIEQPSRNEFRVSPLVATAGQESLSPAEQVRVHRAIAEHLMALTSVSVTQGDALLHHAMAGGDERHVIGYANSLITARSTTLELLARHSPSVVELQTSRLLYPNNVTASLMLRLGQLLVALAGDNDERAAEVWTAMRRELDERDRDGGPDFEIVILSKILIQTRIPAAIPEWLDLLLRFDEMCRSDERLRQIAEATKAGRQTPGEVQGFAFVHQATSLRSPADLRAALEKLDAVGPDVRARLFSGLTGSGGNYGHLIDSSWVRIARTEGFNADQAAADYRAMAALAEQWADPELAARCYAAVSVMLDEYATNPERALEALAEAEARLGSMTTLSRARAKIHWRLRDHARALTELEAVWSDTHANSDGVERGFIAREAGISAAETDRWADARTWFERAIESFAPYDSGTLPAMRIGLVADAAQAAFKAGDSAGAIAGYARTIKALEGLDADSSLQAGYCHRVVRNAVLWLMREVREDPVDYEETVLPAGACSNPDPTEAILERPLGPLDIAWYLLADAALDLGDVEFFSGLHQRLSSGPILGLEVSRRKKLADYQLDRRDADSLLAAVPAYAAGLAYLDAERPALMAGDMLNPTRAEPPPQLLDGTEAAAARRGAVDLLLAFAILRAIEGDINALKSVRAALDSGEWSSVRSLARFMIGAEGEMRDVAELTAGSVAAVAAAGGKPIDPQVAMAATIWFVIWASRSEFKNKLAKPLGSWIAATWTTIVEEHSFRLRNPRDTAPAITTAIAVPREPLALAAAVALAADAAVPFFIPTTLRNLLEELAET